MTSKAKALTLIPVQLTCPEGQRAKGIQLPSTCNLRQESHKTQAWLRFLFLSFLSISVYVASAADTADLQTCLKMLQHTIENSDAMLYAPSINDIEEKCKSVSLKCYMLELIMVLNEENVMDKKASCIFDFNDNLHPNSVACPPCEKHSLENITIFLDRLNDLLKKMTTQQNK